MKKGLLLLALLMTTVAWSQNSNTEEKQLTKFEQIASETGRIIKFQDVKLPNVALNVTSSLTSGILKASIRLVMSNNDMFFYRLEKPETNSTIGRVAAIEYTDLVEINKALVTLVNAVEEDVAAKPDYLENKFRTEDGLEIGYYISNSGLTPGKAVWFIKLERYSNSTVFVKNSEEIVKRFSEAQAKIEELRASRN